MHGVKNDYFGKPWDVPALKDGKRVRTPLGRRCGYCRFRITPRARGFILPGFEAARPEGRRVVKSPWHRECMVASTVGHLHGHCRCTADGGTPRERYRVAVCAWNATCPADLQSRVPIAQPYVTGTAWCAPSVLVLLTIPLALLGWWIAAAGLWLVAGTLAAANVVRERSELRWSALATISYLIWVAVCVAAAVYTALEAA